MLQRQPLPVPVPPPTLHPPHSSPIANCTALPAVVAAGAPVVMLHAAPIPGVRIRVPKVSSGLDKRRARQLACHVSACRCQR